MEFVPVFVYWTQLSNLALASITFISCSVKLGMGKLPNYRVSLLHGDSSDSFIFSYAFWA